MLCPHAGLPPSSPATAPMSLRPVLCLALGIFRCRVYSIEVEGEGPRFHTCTAPIQGSSLWSSFGCLGFWASSKGLCLCQPELPNPPPGALKYALFAFLLTMLLVSRKWSALVCSNQGLRWRGCNQERLNTGSGPVHCRVLRSEHTSAPPPLPLSCTCSWPVKEPHQDGLPLPLLILEAQCAQLGPQPRWAVVKTSHGSWYMHLERSLLQTYKNDVQISAT